ncbi:MAG: RNA polymerase sigma factor [Candidatus Rokubacteria bacterium]|nr:RNA polymerase sigma factor [Candidatus Rokubacteria bacterium]
MRDVDGQRDLGGAVEGVRGRWEPPDAGGLSDEALCRRAADRDETAFDLLVARYQQRAYRLAWSLLRDAEEARDLSQEAFVRLWETAGSFAGRSRFSTWFYRILVNLCLDHRRKRRADAPGPLPDGEDTPAPGIDPVARLEREEAMRPLWPAVDRLAPRQRAALLLQLEDLSTGEIAAVLKCSEATVRVHLHRALTTLRKAMGTV